MDRKATIKARKIAEAKPPRKAKAMKAARRYSPLCLKIFR